MIGDMSRTDIVSEFALLDGKLKCQYFTSGDERGEAVGYYNNGQLRFKYPLVKGELSGQGKAYFEDGSLCAEEHFIAGLRHGKSREWYKNGVLKKESHFLSGLCHGEDKEWFESGRQKHRREYVQGMLHGPCIEWYPSGQLKQRVAYRLDRLHGICVFWDEKGNLTGRRIYVRGVRISGDLHNRIEKGTLSARLILRITNTAIRRICLEEFGYSRFLAQLPHKILDKDGEYELTRIDWHKREEPIYLVKVKCPSTGAFYTLRVPPTMKSVKEAVAWTFDVGADEYMPEIET